MKGTNSGRFSPINVISAPPLVVKSAHSLAMAHSLAVIYVCFLKNWFTRLYADPSTFLNFLYLFILSRSSSDKQLLCENSSPVISLRSGMFRSSSSMPLFSFEFTSIFSFFSFERSEIYATVEKSQGRRPATC